MLKRGYEACRLLSVCTWHANSQINSHIGCSRSSRYLQQMPFSGVTAAPGLYVTCNPAHACLSTFSNCRDAGIPHNNLHLGGGQREHKPRAFKRVSVAEFGTLQLEFIALSRRVNNATYGDVAEAALHNLHQKFPDTVRASLDSPVDHCYNPQGICISPLARWLLTCRYCAGNHR